MNTQIRTIVVGIMILILLTGVGLVVLAKHPRLRLELARGPVVQFLLPTYRSLRKIADIPYLPYQFAHNDLSVYDITVDVADIARMNSALPDDFLKGRLTDEYKLEVRAAFKTNNYEDRINIRYRGRGPNHWNAYKKSFHLEFDNDNPFNGITDLKLIIPEDRQYAIEPLNNYRAKKMGIFAPQPWFVQVRLNGDDLGVYHAIPHWGADLTDRNGYSERANIFGLVDLQLNELDGRNFFDPAEITLWEDYTRNTDTYPEDIILLKEFLTFLHDAPDNIYARALPMYVDMDTLYAWLILNTLGGSAHQNATVNIILLRNPATGRFQPVPWDIQIYPANTINLASHPLIGRTLAVPEFRKEFLRRLKTYVSDEANLADDLQFFDKTINAIKPALYKDTAKLPLNIVVGHDIAENRKLVEKNFNTMRHLFETNMEHALFENQYTNYTPRNDFMLPLFIAAATENTSQFLQKHKQFYLRDINEIGIGPGILSMRTTAILPINTRLVIAPGTTILFGSGVSLVTFQPITAKGTKSKPITLRGIKNDPWGTVLVLGNKTQSVNIFSYIYASGGSGFVQDGIQATGMLAIHNGNTEIRNSIFDTTYDDDAVNIKWGSIAVEHNIFRNTFGDAIDLDSARGVIRNNIFKTIGRDALKRGAPNGDAIDMSFSILEVTDNTIDTCGDKGISVGEISKPYIAKNIIVRCGIGISIKDSSEAHIDYAYLLGNTIGLEIIRKKSLFSGGIAHLTNSVLWANNTDIIIQPESGSLLAKNMQNTIQERGDTEPDFISIFGNTFELIQNIL